MTSLASRGLGALYGLAIGDALGMPTQSLPHELIVERYGEIRWFHGATDDHPLAAGMPAGSITDDTEQALILADLLIVGRGRVDPVHFAQRLTDWESDMRRRGSKDLLGPSTSAAIVSIQQGVPVDQVGRYGATNGAAMRIPPLGLIVDSSDIDDVVRRTVEISSLTHNTTIALAGAAAVAAAVAAGMSGASVEDASKLAVEAAGLAAGHGHWVAGADVGWRIRWAADLVSGRGTADAADLIYGLVGTGLATQESVPAAFAVLSLLSHDPWEAVLLASSLGGDCDTIAAIVGSVAGACHGVEAFPAEARQLIQSVNHLDLESICSRLLRMRPDSPGQND